MNFLGIDTTGKLASVVVKTNGKIYNGSDINNVTHSEKLLPLIHKTLQESNLKFEDIDMLMVTNGPGSFTGCRIGVATIKALSHPNKLNILAISSLELIAYATYFNLEENEEKYICSMLDARNNRVYYCVYKIYTQDNKIVIENVHEISNEDLFIALDDISNFNSCVFSGDCIDKFEKDILNYAEGKNLNYTCINDEVLPDAKYLAHYYDNVLQDILDKKIYNTFNLDVVYARVSQAERMKNEQ